MMRPEPGTPWSRYQAALQRPQFVHDSAQEAAVGALQRLYERLLQQAPPSGLPGLLARLRPGPPTPVRGLYLWGGVGRGKTWLMDSFYETLPIKRKRRVHFHRFMEDVHDALRRYGDRDDPLALAGAELAEQARVLCFDEFFVSDIADAMIMAGLLDALFAHGVTLVATSNLPPDRLYQDGLQRAKFLPAIEQIKQHCEVLQVDGGVDYRLRILQGAEIYHYPLGEDAERILRQSFFELAPGEVEENTRIRVNHRPLPVIAIADGIGWFSFAALCEGPRAAPDYIELGRRFNTVMISDVPCMGEGSNDPARRFISLVDELYDRDVNLILSAACPLDTLYQGQRLSFEFERTRSRLIEMQSREYLGREHKA